MDGKSTGFYLPVVFLACALIALPAVAQFQGEGMPVDVELVIAADGSGSITDVELAVQRDGYAAAMTDPRVLDIIMSGSFGRIAVAYLEWGGAFSQEIIADWHLIEDAASAEAFAAVVRAAPRKAEGWNSISNAIAVSTAMIATNEYDGFRRVIDVSGDSGQRGGMPLPLARERAIAEGITINGLALNHRGGGMSGPGGEPLERHYERDIIGGPGAFVLTVEEPDGFHDAILNKLLLEIAGVQPGEKSDLASLTGDPLARQ